MTASDAKNVCGWHNVAIFLTTSMVTHMSVITLIMSKVKQTSSCICNFINFDIAG